jgi:hypothetical protein
MFRLFIGCRRPPRNNACITRMHFKKWAMCLKSSACTAQQICSWFSCGPQPAQTSQIKQSIRREQVPSLSFGTHLATPESAKPGPGPIFACVKQGKTRC